MRPATISATAHYGDSGTMSTLGMSRDFLQMGRPPRRPDCVAGHVGLELRNVVANYPFERPHKFPGIPPNSDLRDHSRLSCGVAETQLGPSAEILATDVTEYLAGLVGQSGLAPVNLTTLPHFSVSSAMSLPKSAGEPANGVVPRSPSRAFNSGSARPALISLLSLSITSTGVFLGAPMPYQALAS